MLEIPVDFNNRARDGLVKASMRSIDRDLVVGESVVAVDHWERMAFRASVASITVNIAYLDVDWSEDVYPSK